MVIVMMMMVMMMVMMIVVTCRGACHSHGGQYEESYTLQGILQD